MAQRSHEQIKQWFANNAHLYDVPEAWLGNEPNAINKDWYDPEIHGRWLHMAPYSYTELVGNYSIPLIHAYLNEHPRWLADRAYGLASQREDRIYAKAGMPLFGAGQKRAMNEFDLIGVSLNFAPLFQTIVRAMQLSDIPRHWEQRVSMDERYPVLMAGANVFGQPATSAPLFDMFWIGDLEDEPDDNGDTSWNPGINYFLDLTADWIQSKNAVGEQEYFTKAGRQAYYEDVARKCPWIWIPRFYTTTYHQIPSDSTPSGQTWTVTAIEPNNSAAPKRVVKRIVREMDRVKALEKPDRKSVV